jgi:hypothetical protein
VSRVRDFGSFRRSEARLYVPSHLWLPAECSRKLKRPSSLVSGTSGAVTGRRERVTDIWNYLPAFRAAAEYLSLQRAGLATSVSPSALSRSIKLLEQALGVSLFDRSPTGLTLTESGKRLLEVTRSAMRLVHDGTPQTSTERLLAGAVGPALSTVLCDAAFEAAPAWPLDLSEVTADHGGDRLRRGELDVIVTHQPLSGPGLAVLPLPELQLVLAMSPGAQRGKVGCLDGEGFEWPGAHLRAPSPALLLRLAERQHLAAWLPRCCVPANWTTEETGAALPTTFVTREYASGLPTILTTLRERLAFRLNQRL